MTGVDVNVPLSADPARLNAAVAAAVAKVAGLRQALSGLQIDADTKALVAKIASLSAQAVKLGRQLQNMPAGLDVTAVQTKILAITAQIRVLESELLDLKMDADTSELMAKLAVAEAELETVTKARDILINVDEVAALGELATLKAALGSLQQSIANIILNVDDTAGLAKLAAIQIKVSALTDKVNSFTVDANIAPAIAELLALQGAVDAFGKSITDSAAPATTALSNLGVAGLLTAGWLGNLSGKTQLFGGVMTDAITHVNLGIPAFIASASALHILADSALEVVAEVVPASIALAAFGIGAAPVIGDIATQMQSVFTVSRALNQNIYPLTGGFQALAKAVQPEVYSLFGDALEIVSSNMGKLQTLAVATGSVVDQLGARITAALTSGGLDQFIKEAAPDLATLGDIFGNIFGTIGNVLKVLPGYAQQLFGALDAVTGAIEALSSNGLVQWLLGAGLAVHGFILWVGLAVTAAIGLGNALLGLGAKFGLAAEGATVFDASEFVFGLLTAVTAVGELGGALITLAGGEAIAAAATGVLDGVLDALGAISPFVWIAAAIAGLTVLITWLARGGSATSAFNTSMSTLVSSGDVNHFAQNVDIAMAQTVTAMGSAHATVVSLTAQVANLPPVSTAAAAATTRFGAAMSTQAVTARGLNAQLQAANATYQGYAGELKTLQGYQDNYNQLLKTAGGNLGFVNAAGITSNDIMDASAGKMKELNVEVLAQVDAFKALSLGTGEQAAALNAMAIPLKENQAALATLTQNEAALLTILTGGQTAFNNFQQSIQGTTAKFVSPSGLADAFTLAGGNLSGLNQQSLAFSNTLYSISIPALQTLIGNLQKQGISQDSLTKVVATGAGQMLQYTGNNVEANAVIASLINNALGPATVSMSTLKGWVDKNSTSLSGMNAIVAQSTVDASKLAGTLQGDLNPMLAASIIAADGGQKAFNTFASSVLGGDTSSKAFTTSGLDVVKTLLASGLNAGASQAKFISYAESLGQSKSQADALWTSLSKQLLDQAGTKAGETKTQFFNLAAELGINSTQAQNLWTTLQHQQLDTTTAKALLAKNQFFALAEQFNLTSTQVNDLWTFFSRQLLDQTTLKAGQTKTGFFNLADQLGITGTQAQNLWTTLSHQLLDQAATKAGETKGQFDQLATSMSVSTTWADNLWNSLHKLPATVNTQVKLSASAAGTLSAVAKSSNTSVSNIEAELQFGAKGMKVPGSGNSDTVHAMLTPGEVVVPKGMVAAGAVDHLRGKLPGFASGGAVNLAGPQNFVSTDSDTWAADMEQAWSKQVTAAMAAAVTKAQVAAATIGATAAAGPGGGAPAANAALAQRLYPAWSGGSAWSAWNALAMAECVPVRTRILTRRGWLSHDEVVPGDETIGYDLTTGHSTWTRITRVMHYEQAETVRFGNSYWSAECTPEHRWLMERMFIDSRTRAESVASESLIELRNRKRLNRVVLARPARLGTGTLPISVREASLLGWIAGDGTVSEPRDYWYDRKPDLPATTEAPFGYRRDGQPKKNGSGAPRKTGQRRTMSPLTIAITQAKPEHFAAIEDSLSGIDVHRAVTRPAGERWLAVHQWRLPTDYSRDLLARAGHPKTDAVAQVLAMSDEQREAWLAAIIAAEGTVHIPEPGKPKDGRKTVIYQVDGPVADAIEIAVYLSGHRPGRSKDSRNGKTAWRIGITSPYIGGLNRRSFVENAGYQDVYCVTTELGTWTAEQDGQVFLTGNSGWNQFADNPSSGAYGIPQALPPTKMPFAAQAAGGSNPTAQIGWMVDYILCMPLDAAILTRQGWKSHAEVQPGDETVGFNLESGEAEWTVVTAVHHYDAAPVRRMHSTTVDLRSTPGHRWITEKYIQTGSSKPDYRRQEMVRTDQIGTRHRIRLAARLKQKKTLPLTSAEAELLGWVAGDGSVYRRSMYGKGGVSAEVRVAQSEAKPEHLRQLRALLSRFPHSEYKPRLNHWTSNNIINFRLSASYAHDLLTRSGYESGLELMVLKMSAAQREAFLFGLMMADGYRYGDRWLLAQNEGQVLDAAVLAATLLGNFCNIVDSAGQKHVVMTRGAFVQGGLDARHQEEYGEEPVWCPTTQLGTWMARQDNQVFLTGNSTYGSPEAAESHEQAYHWYTHGGQVKLPRSSSARRYDSGGWLPTGASVAVNNTGSPERVTPGGGSSKLSPDAQAIIAALQENTAAVQGQGTSFSRALNSTAGAAAFRGSYSNRR